MGVVSDLNETLKIYNWQQSLMAEAYSNGYKPSPPKKLTNADIMANGTYDLANPDCDCEEYG